MNKLFKLILVAAVLVSSAPAFAYDSPTYETYTNKSVNAGAQGNPVRVVKLVRFSTQGNSIQAISAGEVVVYDTISDDGVSVRRATTSADAAFAGIAATAIPSADAGSTSAQSDAGRRNWGWIVVHGPATANTGNGGSGGASAGSAIITSRDGGMVTTFETVSTDVNGVNAAIRSTAGAGGFFMQPASASSTDSIVFVMSE